MACRCVPPSLAGVVFLSGGQTEAQATVNLNAIVKCGRSQNIPCGLTFSYGRSLQVNTIDENSIEPNALHMLATAVMFVASTHSCKMAWTTQNSSTNVQASVLNIWSKDITSPTQQVAAKKMAVALAAANASATLGQFSGKHPSSSSATLKEAFRGWT